MVRRDLAVMERRQRWALVGGLTALGLCVLLGVWFAGYLVHVAHRFPREPFHQPTRLYARPTVLGLGTAASVAALVDELEDLGYREADPEGPPPRGTYGRAGGTLIIHLR